MCRPTAGRSSRTWAADFWNRPGLNRLKAALQPGDCVKVAALDRLGRSLPEVLGLLGWLREKGVEVVSLRESIDQDSATGRVMLHLAIVFAETERDLARERTLAGLERVKATGKHLGRRKGSQSEAGRRGPEHAVAPWTLVGPHRYDNRATLRQCPPVLHLESRRDSADGLRGRITGPESVSRELAEPYGLGDDGRWLRSSGRGSEMAKSMAASLTAAVRRGYDAARRCDGYGSHAFYDPRGHTAPALGALYDHAVRYSAGVGGVGSLTGGAPTADVIEYPDGTMGFNPTVGWGKDGLAYSIRSALDRERACRAVGLDTTPDADKEAA